MMIEIKDFQKNIDRHTTLDIPLLIVDSGEIAAALISTLCS
jgi:hypothetical protein